MEIWVRWPTIKGLHGAKQTSVPNTSRPPSNSSSRGVSPAPLEHRALLKLEAQLCASVGDYKGMINKAQQLSAANKSCFAQPTHRSTSVYSGDESDSVSSMSRGHFGGFGTVKFDMNGNSLADCSQSGHTLVSSPSATLLAPSVDCFWLKGRGT